MNACEARVRVGVLSQSRNHDISRIPTFINPLNQPMVGWSIFQGWLMRLLTINQLPNA